MKSCLGTIRCVLFFLFIGMASLMAQEVSEIETSREFDEDFKSHYEGRRYDYEGEEVMSRAQWEPNQKAAPYENREPTTFDDNEVVENESTEIRVPNFFSTLAWIIVPIVLVLIVYLIFGGNKLFGNKGNTKINVEDEITEENIETADIDTLIQKAEAQGNLRLAVRYHYLLILKKLVIKDLIKFEDKKTNADYLSEITNPVLNKGFSYVSYLYSYIWYGEFSINEFQYQQAKADFVALKESIK